MIYVSVESIVFLKELEDIVLNEVGLNAVFECEISRTDYKAEWYHGDKLIRRSDKYNMTSEGGKHTMTVEHSQPDDIGQYTVKLNGVSSKAKLIIKGKLSHTLLVKAGRTSQIPQLLM